MKYSTPTDPDSAYEFLDRLAKQEAIQEAEAKQAAAEEKALAKARAKQLVEALVSLVRS